MRTRERDKRKTKCSAVRRGGSFDIEIVYAWTRERVKFKVIYKGAWLFLGESTNASVANSAGVSRVIMKVVL
jgi:hypothetical protein